MPNLVARVKLGKCYKNSPETAEIFIRTLNTIHVKVIRDPEIVIRAHIHR